MKLILFLSLSLFLSVNAWAGIAGTTVTLSASQFDTTCNNGVIERQFKGVCPSSWNEGALGSLSSNLILFESFENGNEQIFNDPNDTSRNTRWQVSQADNGGRARPQALAISSANVAHGSNSLAVTVDDSTAGGGNMFAFRSTNENLVGPVNNIKYLRETVTGYEALDTFNRLEFWIYIPDEFPSAGSIGQTNLHFGTYTRALSASVSSEESDNGHYYHYLNLEPHQNWHRVIIDSHPDHQRGASGSTEQGVIETGLLGDAGYNYFDLMTRFYIDGQGTLSAHPSTFYLDGFRMYEESRDEDIDNIYSLSGVASNVNANQIVVSWRRNKTRDDDLFDIKYAFSSFHENGGFLAHGANAPSGQNIDPAQIGGYNGMRYTTDQIDLSGQSSIFIAIKSQLEQTRFREIEIPLTAARRSEIIGGGQ